MHLFDDSAIKKQYNLIHCQREGSETFYLTLVSRFFLQGKNVRAVVIKSRSTGAKATLNAIPSASKKAPKCSRSTSVPVDRKENVIEFVPQPCCSHTSSAASSSSMGVQRMKPGLRPNKTANLRNRVKNLRSSSSSEKPKITRACTAGTQASCKQRIKVDVASKLSPPTRDAKQPANKKVKEDNERVQLREICFIKDGDGKKLVAKYNKSENGTLEDSLIVSWEPGSSNAQVFAQKSPAMPNFLTGKIEPGPSKKGAFRVHNFSKNISYSKAKRNKRNLRRLAGNNESSGKIEKVKKRKKMKAKVTV